MSKHGSIYDDDPETGLPRPGRDTSPAYDEAYWADQAETTEQNAALLRAWEEAAPLVRTWHSGMREPEDRPTYKDDN